MSPVSMRDYMHAIHINFFQLSSSGLEGVLIKLEIFFIGRRMSIQKMLRKRIPLHPSWNYIIFASINR
jgi:hypothetical protein